MILDPIQCRKAILARDARFDGRFFTCVKTTGIYCRSICPARPPKPENCFFVPTAAAAQEAGFRPCLRCRPETAPDMGAWRGTCNTVSRGLALIENGALDGADVESLAERLGVGGRHLRRLFQEHLGASPVAVAQTRRVLLAKQLLHETDLPITEVAMAAGFGSLRRFNETFQALFDRPPRALRREGRAAAPAGSAVTLGLGYKSPYDWAAMLAFLSARAIPGVERVDAGAWTRAIDIGGRAGWVNVSHDAERRRLVARLSLPDWKALPSVVARLRRLFDLAADPALIAPALAEDARLKPLVAARPGLRVPGCWDGFELAVRAILGQQISVGAAIALAGRITEAHGTAIAEGAAPEGLTRLFPTPEALAEAEIGGMPRSRSAAINALARSTLENPRLFDREASLEDSIAKLKALKGVGDWTAHYIAMRALREPDAFPAADVGLMRALDGGAGRPDATTLEDWSQAWRPWRAYAAQHLWTSDSNLENPREIAA
jgi:AraC family transcriptional regulator, regulatory protein of adaptative response / DNA-3-methyladenine glycosylase II